MMFRAQCIHCRKQVSEQLTNIGDAEAALLRAHLRACYREIAETSIAALGGLLNHFRLVRMP